MKWSFISVDTSNSFELNSVNANETVACDLIAWKGFLFPSDILFTLIFKYCIYILDSNWIVVPADNDCYDFCLFGYLKQKTKCFSSRSAGSEFFVLPSELLPTRKTTTSTSNRVSFYSFSSILIFFTTHWQMTTFNINSSTDSRVDWSNKIGYVDHLIFQCFQMR